METIVGTRWLRRRRFNPAAGLRVAGSQMRVLYYYNFIDAWDCECYIVRALERAGCEVISVDHPPRTSDNLSAAISRHQPDLLLFAKAGWQCSSEAGGWLGFSEIIERHRRAGNFGIAACWSFDLLSREFNRFRWTWANRMTELMDLFFTSDGWTAPHLPLDRTGHFKVVVLRQAIGDDVRPGVPRDHWKCDVLFAGGRYRNRLDWAISLAQWCEARGLVFRHVRRGVHGGDLCDLFASAKVVVGPHFPSQPGYWSNRLYVTTGYGGCLVTPEIPGMREEGWIPDVHYAKCAPGDGDESFRRIEEIINDPVAEADIANAGERFCLENHTYDHRVRLLLDRVQQELDYRSYMRGNR